MLNHFLYFDLNSTLIYFPERPADNKSSLSEIGMVLKR